MKDRIMMMYDHIRSSVDVDPWAIKVLQEVLDAYLADGCKDCAFEDVHEWEMPCKRCRNNCKNYWQRKADKNGKEKEEED